MENKIAIGCLVQWYEIKLIEEYLQSLKNALDQVENKKNVVVDILFNLNQGLEQVDTDKSSISDIRKEFYEILNKLFGYDDHYDDCMDYNINLTVHDINGGMEQVYTIADYRRDFNDKYCTEVDILMWGESDALIPRQTFEILDNLHNGVKDSTPKYVAFFATCKMWDKSWEILEHPEFTVKPFKDIGNRVETKDWWSLRYSMNIDEMNAFNDKVEELDIRTTNRLKFNGCGLVISSDVVKSGVNIPKGSFFVHEDTAFMNNCLIMFQGKLPQYIIKNILLVHNRKHTKKRTYIKGEDGISPGDVTSGRRTHDWYAKANKLSEHNAHSMFNQSKIYTWEDVFND